MREAVSPGNSTLLGRAFSLQSLRGIATEGYDEIRLSRECEKHEYAQVNMTRM